MAFATQPECFLSQPSSEAVWYGSLSPPPQPRRTAQQGGASGARSRGLAPPAPCPPTPLTRPCRPGQVRGNQPVSTTHPHPTDPSHRSLTTIQPRPCGNHWYPPPPPAVTRGSVRPTHTQAQQHTCLHHKSPPLYNLKHSTIYNPTLIPTHSPLAFSLSQRWLDSKTTTPPPHHHHRKMKFRNSSKPHTCYSRNLPTHSPETQVPLACCSGGTHSPETQAPLACCSGGTHSPETQAPLACCSGGQLCSNKQVRGK